MAKYLDGVAHGDPHLERFNAWFPKEIVPDPLGLQLQSIQRAVDLARKRGTKNVFLTGDIFHTSAPRQESIARLLKLFADNPDITFWLYLGNHDKQSHSRHALVISDFISKAGILSNVKVYVEPTLEKIEGFPVLFMPYGKFYELDSAYLGFGHTGLAGTMYNEHQTAHEKIKIENSRSPWVMGHIHQAQETKGAIYPGTAYQVDFGEKLPKHLMYFRARLNRDRVTLEHELIVQAPLFRLINVVVNNEDDLATIKPYKPGKIPNFYKLQLARGVKPPPKFMIERPNVIFTEAINAKGEKLEVTRPERAPAEVMKFSPTTGLVKYLTANGMTKKRARMAKDLVKIMAQGE